MKVTTDLDLRKGIHKDRGGALRRDPILDRLHRYCQEHERAIMVELKC